MAERVNVTTAAKLTGRSEKTIRAWLDEDPPALAFEYGEFRGGRFKQDGKKRILVKGQTRLVDVGELRRVHEAHGGIEWYDQFLPVPDVAALAALVRDLQARVLRLEGERGVRALTMPYVRPERPPAPPRAAPAPSTPSSEHQGNRKPLPEGATPLPDGWISLNQWVVGHNLHKQDITRDLKEGDRLPKPETPAEGVIWYYRAGKNGKPYFPESAYSPAQHVAACEAAHVIWPKLFIESCGDECPYAHRGDLPAAE